MKPVLLMDFGSTYTKITAVDVEAAELLGTAKHFTTVQTDINEGLDHAMAELLKKTGSLDFKERYACSSAAGGLRMVTCGLVPELTAEAARRASLGAGAKVVKVYSYDLTDEDIEEIDGICPDILLLTGGIDGGNKDCILHNAKKLSGCKSSFPILLAGNRSCAKECEALLSGREVYRCENVMPKIGSLNIAPVQEQIRSLFLKKIVHAKGLSQAQELISGILMPTPSAVLRAMVLLADGTKTQPGIGELMAVDLGGATTDIYSVAAGNPVSDTTVLKGLPEPYAKRTVEGDLGMRYSAAGIMEAVGAEALGELSGLGAARAAEMVEYLSRHPDTLPETPEEEALDFALAALAVETAVDRHAGTIEQIYTPMGLTYVQTGKDLRGIGQIVFTGGALISGKSAGDIAGRVLYSKNRPDSLKPESAEVLIDRHYILAAMGLLGEIYPDTALTIMKKEFMNHGT